MADVTFLGCGAGYNPILGPNSAYFKINSTLYLLDCGTSVFERLAEQGILNGIKRVVVLISHQHADHIGSLGILLDYCWDVLGIRSLLVHPSGMLVQLMRQMGVSPYASEWIGGDYYPYDANHVSVRFIPVAHAPDIPSFSFLIDADGDRFYYSGDANDIPDEIIAGLENGTISRIYQDTASGESDYHCPFPRLCQKITPQFRQQVYCMHLDAAHDPAAIQEAGFRLASANR